MSTAVGIPTARWRGQTIDGTADMEETTITTNVVVMITTGTMTITDVGIPTMEEAEGTGATVEEVEGITDSQAAAREKQVSRLLQIHDNLFVNVVPRACAIRNR